MAAWAGMCVKQADDLRKNGHYKQNVILKSVKWEHAMASWGVQESEGKALTGGTEVCTCAWREINGPSNASYKFWLAMNE